MKARLRFCLLFFSALLNFQLSAHSLQLETTLPSAEKNSFAGLGEEKLILNAEFSRVFLTAAISRTSFEDIYSRTSVVAAGSYSFIEPVGIGPALYYTRESFPDYRAEQVWPGAALFVNAARFRFRFNAFSKENYEVKLNVFNSLAGGLETSVYLKREFNLNELSVENSFYLNRTGGTGSGYNLTARSISLFAWLNIGEKLTLRSALSLPSERRPGYRTTVSLRYELGGEYRRPVFFQTEKYRAERKGEAVSEGDRKHAAERKINSINPDMNNSRNRKQNNRISRRRKKLKPASFAKLLRWGLSPAQALAFRRSGSICQLSLSSRRILKKKGYFCDGARQ